MPLAMSSVHMSIHVLPLRKFDTAWSLRVEVWSESIKSTLTLN